MSIRNMIFGIKNCLMPVLAGDAAVEKSHVYDLDKVGAAWEKMFEEVLNEK